MARIIITNAIGDQIWNFHAISSIQWKGFLVIEPTDSNLPYTESTPPTSKKYGGKKKIRRWENKKAKHTYETRKKEG